MVAHLAFVVIGDVEGGDDDGRGHQVGEEVAALGRGPGDGGDALLPLSGKGGTVTAIATVLTHILFLFGASGVV